ncbi:hypothetical protein JA1_004213 [Spathaspora sp. JA1]|nr:hypothetical protein JA1_004213 [Spathaspora sp. JA1]
MNRENNKRKAIDGVEGDDVTKRLKLDALFDDLSISDTTHSFIHRKDKSSTKTQVNYIINPNIKSVPYGGIAKKSVNSQQQGAGSTSSHNLDTFLSERLNEHLREMISSQMSLIPWYDYRFLIVYRFHRWVIRLFNRFVKGYNRRTQQTIPRFKSFDSILNLVNNNSITLAQLFDIVLQENQIELVRLRNKFEKLQLRRESKKRQEEINIEKDIRYNYWDNLKLDHSNDYEMVDTANNGDRKLFELDSSYESDVDMASEESSSEPSKFYGL